MVNGIKNLIIWFTTIWNDWWWDDRFFFLIIRKKLILMEKNFRKYGHHVGNKADANKMKLCINLINRIMNDDYMKQAYKKHNEKWGESKMVFTPTDNKYLNNILHVRPNVKNKRDEELERKNFVRCAKHYEKLQNQDLDLLFKTLRKNIRSWWD